MRFVRRQAAREDGCNMKRIKLEICNGLMDAAITRMLEHTEGFSVIRGAAVPADVLLMESAYDPGFTLDDCLARAKQLHNSCPECKVILLCDENSAPEGIQHGVHSVAAGTDIVQPGGNGNTFTIEAHGDIAHGGISAVAL